MKIFKNDPNCFFWQEGNCILHSRWWCLICPWRIKKIAGLNDVGSYLAFVHDRHHAKISFIVSIISVVVAIISTLIAFLVLLTNENAVILLRHWFS
jgi:hypothetical protein